MRGFGTGVVVLAVVGVAAAAAVDAFRGGTEPARPRAAEAGRSEPEHARAVAALREAGVGGTLIWSDAACRLHALRLPDLTPAAAPRIETCTAHVQSGGIGAFEGDVVWAGLGFGTVQVVLSKEHLGRAVRRAPGYEGVGGYRAVQAVSLGGRRIAAILEDEQGLDRIFTLFHGGRLVFLLPRWELGARGTLRRSPRGTYVALVERRNVPVVRVFTAGGESVRLPENVAGPHAIAWSPDERWTALSTRASVYIFPTSAPDGPVVRIPAVVRDLAWEADPAAGADALADELRAAGVNGVLTYADEDCRQHALALPDLEPHPAPAGRACRLPGLVALRFGQPVGDPQRVLVAGCRRGRIDVRELGGRRIARAPGCRPAWRPDGTLTAIRGGEVVAAFPPRVLLSRRDLARAFHGRPDAPEVVEHAWLDGGRLAVLTRGREGKQHLLVLDGGRPLAGPYELVGGRARLRPSPQGRFLGVVSPAGRMLVLDARGRILRWPRTARALTWSPDERWAAVATESSVVLLRSGRERVRSYRLPLAATDLVWR